MHEGQLPLFQRKTFPVVGTQTTIVLPPTPDASVMRTLPAYHLYLKTAGYSRYTPDDFHGDVKKFALYLQSKAIQEITTQDIQGWIAYLHDKERMSAKTISRKTTALSNYFTWLLSLSVIATNPIAGIYNKRITSPLPTILYQQECDRLLVAASKDVRDYLFVSLLLETGMKTEELFALRLGDFDFSNKYMPTVLVRHTGRKEKKTRLLSLPVAIMPVFTEYIATYAITDSLFPLTTRFMQMRLRALATQATLHKEVSAKILRDTFAVQLLRRGNDIETVLKKLGLQESTWEDAKKKYLALALPAL